MVLTLEDEATVLVFRRHTLLPLDNCLYALQTTTPHLTRSSLHFASPGNIFSAAAEIPHAMDLGEPLLAHAFEYACAQNCIDHWLTKQRHPWANGQVERMNHTLKEAILKRFHCETHDQFRNHLADFVNAYKFGHRLKTIKGLARGRGAFDHLGVTARNRGEPMFVSARDLDLTQMPELLILSFWRVLAAVKLGCSAGELEAGIGPQVIQIVRILVAER